MKPERLIPIDRKMTQLLRLRRIQANFPGICVGNCYRLYGLRHELP